MVKIRKQQIDEIRYPANNKNDNFIHKLNQHDNLNKWHIKNSNNVYIDEENNNKDFNFTIII